MLSLSLRLEFDRYPVLYRYQVPIPGIGIKILVWLFYGGWFLSLVDPVMSFSNVCNHIGL